MTKVLFVCLGNICRSPMAEYVFNEIIREKKIENRFFVTSGATSLEEVGNGMHPGTKAKLDSLGVPYKSHCAKVITKSDYKDYNYILGMELSNIKAIEKIMGVDTDKKVFRLLDFSNNPRDIADPWYTGNFDKTYENVLEGCKCFLKHLGY